MLLAKHCFYVRIMIRGWNSGITLSCHKDHQNALLAGLLTVASIDANLQDDENRIKDMIDENHRGYDVGDGVRKTRTSDTLFKRLSAQAFYKLLNLMGVSIVFNHADFRLICRRVIDALKEFQEVNLFLSGLIPSIGFSSSLIAVPACGRENRLA